MPRSTTHRLAIRVKGTGTANPVQQGDGLIALGHWNVEPAGPGEAVTGGFAVGIIVVCRMLEDGHCSARYGATFHAPTSSVDDLVYNLNANRTDLITRPAGGTGPEHVLRDMAGQGGVIPGVKGGTESQDHLTGAQGCARGERWADRIAAPTGGAGIRLQQVRPREIAPPLCSWRLSDSLWHTQRAWQDGTTRGPAQRAVYYMAKKLPGEQRKKRHAQGGVRHPKRPVPLQSRLAVHAEAAQAQRQRVADNTPALEGRHVLRNAGTFEAKPRHTNGQK
jgi:hypothetical protein